MNAAEDKCVFCEKVLLLKRLIVPNVCEGVRSSAVRSMCERTRSLEIL